ncbi:hypothetical protein [Nonomuraea sp. GTA35]|uniref:hypothetical protein n=1 Tax=Nonomuraea sp. GTA35 TaxID=1676746 RepID=UPI0035BF1E2F
MINVTDYVLNCVSLTPIVIIAVCPRRPGETQEDALVGTGLDAGVNAQDDSQVDRGAGVTDLEPGS